MSTQFWRESLAWLKHQIYRYVPVQVPRYRTFLNLYLSIEGDLLIGIFRHIRSPPNQLIYQTFMEFINPVVLSATQKHSTLTHSSISGKITLTIHLPLLRTMMVQRSWQVLPRSVWRTSYAFSTSKTEMYTQFSYHKVVMKSRPDKLISLGPYVKGYEPPRDDRETVHPWIPQTS
ncbi:hypothetical protein ARMGADRAFT_1036710 [Armillaria gallica]|uniref:Uncharacterized protein n=1 Tax=Armillaria gallica TaxID=47427 RepID=A0A2H3CPK5_ARMGA|nr:hypothetical protein ARMGADRAFT_1036710 [Armillaria gallica]